MAGDLVISTINGGAIGTKNVIIDGNFNVNQRGVSGTVTLAAGAYGHDRWKGGASGCTYTFATVENVTTLTISAGSLIQVVEGLNLQSGIYTLSFSGTAQGKIKRYHQIVMRLYASLGGKVAEFVHPIVAEALKNKFAK
jgi:hypothetical protein